MLLSLKNFLKLFSEIKRDGHEEDLSPFIYFRAEKKRGGGKAYKETACVLLEVDISDSSFISTFRVHCFSLFNKCPASLRWCVETLFMN